MPYRGSVEGSFVAAQEALLTSGDYIWPWDDVDPEWLEDDEYQPPSRPASLQELRAAKEDEEFWEEGTHTLLDLERVMGSDEEEEFAAVRPLTDDESIEVFGTSEPTMEDFERVYEPGPSGQLGELMGPKWSGRCLVIHSGGRPVEVYFWGWSGD